MASIIAISGNKKVVVVSGLNQKNAAIQRRELVSAEENFDMLSNQICKYRTKRK